MTLPHLKALAVGDEVADVHGVAVLVARTPQQLAVVVDTGCSRQDFLLAVVIHIGSHYVVVAVAVSSALVAAVVDPALDELAVLHIHS